MVTRVPGRISVCIPTYNRCALLAEALASVLTQVVADVEILVGDDGSSDETEALVMSFADPRVSYLRNERNLGHAQNINTLKAKATGEYLAILFDDDAMFPGHLRIVAGLLDRYPEAVMAHTAYELWMTHGRRETVRLATEPFEESGRHFVRRVVANPPRVWIATALMRASEVADINFRDADAPATDVGFWLRVAQRGAVAYDPTPFGLLPGHGGLQHRKPVPGDHRWALRADVQDRSSISADPFDL